MADHSSKNIGELRSKRPKINLDLKEVRIKASFSDSKIIQSLFNYYSTSEKNVMTAVVNKRIFLFFNFFCVQNSMWARKFDFKFFPVWFFQEVNNFGQVVNLAQFNFLALNIFWTLTREICRTMGYYFQ